MDISEIDDAVAAAVFRRLVTTLRALPADSEQVLLALARFNRYSLAEWLSEASSGALDIGIARDAVFGRQADGNSPAPNTSSEADRKASEDALDEALDESFPASDPPSMTDPAGRSHGPR